MSQFFTLLTKTGQGLLANAIAYGEPLTIATMAIGDGGGTLPTPDATVTRLVNEVRRGPINQTAVDDANPNWTVVEQVLPADVGGWTIREVGLYDTDGNLIAYGNYPETYKPRLSEGSSRTQTIRFVMEVTDTSAVTLRIDPSVVMASRKYVDEQRAEHEKSRNHPYATTTLSGMTELATGAEAKARTDKKTVLTPETGGQMLGEHEQAAQAHDAGQISSDAIPQAPGAVDVQSALKSIADLAGSSFQNMAFFTRSGTSAWDVPDVLKKGIKQPYLTVIGAGGGGAVETSTGPGGGGAGGITEGFLSLEGVETVSVTVGKGGVRRQTANGDGLPGSSSSFGSFASATGGDGGQRTGAGGRSGRGTGLALSGGLGDGAYGSASSGGSPAGGTGGGIGGGRGQSGAGADGSWFGAGGGGSTTDSGAGANGLIMLRW